MRMKRIFLFLITNIAVLLTLGVVANLLCTYLLGTPIEQLVGPEWTIILVYAFIYGMLGAFISLLFSKQIAKMSCKAKTIDGSEGEVEGVGGLVDDGGGLSDVRVELQMRSE